jgi:hypothetical protein
MPKEVTYIVFYRFIHDHPEEEPSMYVTDEPDLQKVKDRAATDKRIVPVKIVSMPEAVVQARRVLASQIDFWNQQGRMEVLIGKDVDDMSDITDPVCAGLDDAPTLEPYEMLFRVVNSMLEQVAEPPLEVDKHVHTYDKETGIWISP